MAENENETQGTEGTGSEESQGLAGTGNPNDLATPQPSWRQGGDDLDPTDAKVAHQEGAPEELAEATDKAEAQGFLGDGVPDKPDYSQGNPSVMNGGKAESTEG